MNRTRRARRIFAFAFTLILALAVPSVAFATDINVTADSTSVKAGDTVTLTVIVSAENIAVASGMFTYDPSLLTYVSSDGGASDGYINIVSAQKGGASSLSAVIKFVAKSAGDAVVSVSMDNVLSYDEQKQGNAEAGVSIAIAASDAPQPTEGDGESIPAVNLAQTGVAAENVTGAAAQMYVWRDLSSLTLPSGFADRQVTYAGEYVGGAGIPDRDDMILLYLSEAAGENAGYYMYNEQKNKLDPYITISSVLKNYTIIWPDESVAAPAGFDAATLEWDEKQLPAWKAPGTDESVYLVYARNSKGETGFYLFNTDDESVQRYAVLPEPGAAVTAKTTEAPTAEPAANEPGEEKEEPGITVDFVLFVAICAFGGLMFVGVAVIVVLYIKKGSRVKPRYALSSKREKETEKTEKPEQAGPRIKEAELSRPPKDKDIQG
jgi:hypothetical protein